MCTIQSRKGCLYILDTSHVHPQKNCIVNLNIAQLQVTILFTICTLTPQLVGGGGGHLHDDCQGRGNPHPSLALWTLGGVLKFEYFLSPTVLCNVQCPMHQYRQYLVSCVCDNTPTKTADTKLPWFSLFTICVLEEETAL